MSPMSPSFMSGGQSNWPQSDWQMPSRLPRKCPKCVSALEDVWGTVGGFPGHMHTHPSSVIGYRCSKCNHYFTLGEFSLLWKGRDRRKEFMRNYWGGIRTGFKSPYLYLVVVCFMILHKSFWAGIVAGIVISFSLPLLMDGLEKTFAPLIKLVRKKFESSPSNKPPDSPPTS